MFLYYHSYHLITTQTPPPGDPIVNMDHWYEMFTTYWYILYIYFILDDLPSYTLCCYLLAVMSYPIPDSFSYY